MGWLFILLWIFWAIALHVSVLEPKFSEVLTFQSVDRNVEKVSLFLLCYFEVLSNSYSIHG